ncbi:MAG: hypothetical protein RIB55_01420 [Nitratireductor sp.]
MRRAASIVVLVTALSAPSGVQAGEDWSTRFATTFQESCVPQRLSYEGTLTQAGQAGWEVFTPAKQSEFGALMAKSAAALEEAKVDMPGMSFRAQTFARDVEGRVLHLVVSLMLSEPLDAIGCYLYDFEATEPVAAAAVSDVLGSKPAQSHSDETVVSHLWGPPPSMPRTLDTYLTFIPPGSPHAEQAGFDGQMLKFSTSQPREDGK